VYDESSELDLIDPRLLSVKSHGYSLWRNSGTPS